MYIVEWENGTLGFVCAKNKTDAKWKLDEIGDMTAIKDLREFNETFVIGFSKRGRFLPGDMSHGLCEIIYGG